MPEKEKTISQMMREKGYSLVGYARSRKLSNIALRDVISGINNGRKVGKARDCVVALYGDGLLPETHIMYEWLSTHEGDKNKDISKSVPYGIQKAVA